MDEWITDRIIDNVFEKSKMIYRSNRKEKGNTWTMDDVAFLIESLTDKMEQYKKNENRYDLLDIINYCWMIFEREEWKAERKDLYGE